MKDKSETECKTQILALMRLTNACPERLKGNKMRVQKLKKREIKFLAPSLDGFAATASGAIAAPEVFWVKRAKGIVQTVNMTNSQTRFLRSLRWMMTWLNNFCARSQMNDNTVEILRSERSGRWCTHSDYIKETIEREKMRAYEIR
jgi:hypothetical protein